jgi:hypothetical protein
VVPALALVGMTGVAAARQDEPTPSMIASPRQPHRAQPRNVAIARWSSAFAVFPGLGWAPLVTLVVAVLGVYLRFLDAGFVGTDTLPAVQSNRVQAWSDLVGFWTRPLMAGTDFAVSQALFYRPIASVSFALDFALWGPDPVGYHLTNALLQVAATVLAYALLREMRLSRGAALLGAAVLAFHPTMATAVPVIARRYDALSAALLFGSLALLCRGAGRAGPARLSPPVGALSLARGDHLSSLALFVGSLLAKESAFGALPLLPLVVFAARRVLHLRVLAPYVLAAGVVFVGRYLVLGSLGGHRDVDVLSLNFEEYRVMLDRYVFFIFWPFRHLYPERTLGWAFLLACMAALLVGALWLADRRTRLLVAAGLVWAAWFGAFFILLRHVAGPWYMYYPLLGLGLAIGASADAVWRSLTQRVRWPETLGGSLLAGLGLVYTLGSLTTSPLVRPYDQWHQAGAIMHQYLAEIATCTEGLPDGTAVTLWNAPRAFDDGTEVSFLLLPSMIEGFTYDAYMRLIRPTQQFNLFIGQPVTYTSVPPDLELSCGWGGPSRRRVIATSASLPPPDFPTD